MRHKSEEILARTKQPYQITLYYGVEHGFSVRGDPNIRSTRFAKEQAFQQAVTWFDEFLVNP
jgi:dienelactone hydrolase